MKLQAPLPLAVALPSSVGAVIDLHRGIGFRRAGQRQDAGVRDAVANRACCPVENDVIVGTAGAAGVDGDAERAEAALVLPATSVAVAVRLWAPLASAAVVIAPVAAAVGGGAAEQRGAVIDLDRGIGFRLPVSVRVLSLVMPSPATLLSVEYEAMVGAHRGHRVDGDAERRWTTALVLPATSLAVALRLWAPLVSAAVVKLQAPAPLAVALPSRVAPS